MILATALDEDFVELASVLLASITDGNASLISDVYILEGGLSEASRDALRAACAKPIVFIDIDARLRQVFGGLYQSNRISIAAYGRYLIPDLLADVDERVLYLDGDTVIVGDLAELAEIDLSGYPVAAVASTYESVATWRRELALPADTPFLNSGVLVLNPAEWRRQRVTEAMVAFLAASNGPRRFVDQGALNAVLRGHFLPLPPKWNLRAKDHRYLSVRANDARILHFTGAYKPNMIGCDHPGTPHFRRIRQRTPFRNAPLRPADGLKRHSQGKRVTLLLRRLAGEAGYWLGLGR